MPQYVTNPWREGLGLSAIDGYSAKVTRPLFSRSRRLTVRDPAGEIVIVARLRRGALFRALAIALIEAHREGVADGRL